MQHQDAGHTLKTDKQMSKMAKKDVELIADDRAIGDDPPAFVRRLSDLSVKVGTRTRLLVEIRTPLPVKVKVSV